MLSTTHNTRTKINYLRRESDDKVQQVHLQHLAEHQGMSEIQKLGIDCTLVNLCFQTKIKKYCNRK